MTLTIESLQQIGEAAKEAVRLEAEYEDAPIGRAGERALAVWETAEAKLTDLAPASVISSLVEEVIASQASRSGDAASDVGGVPSGARCQKCGELAVWEYAPSDGFGNYCDQCVPRGCSCNTIDYSSPDGEQKRDEHGRLLPCCEYWFYAEGFAAKPKPSEASPALDKPRAEPLPPVPENRGGES